MLGCYLGIKDLYIEIDVVIVFIHATVNLLKTKPSNANLCHQFKKKHLNT